MDLQPSSQNAKIQEIVSVPQSSPPWSRASVIATATMCKVWGSLVSTLGLVFRVLGFGFRVLGLGFGV